MKETLSLFIFFDLFKKNTFYAICFFMRHGSSMLQLSFVLRELFDDNTFDDYTNIDWI